MIARAPGRSGEPGQDPGRRVTTIVSRASFAGLVLLATLAGACSKHEQAEEPAATSSVTTPATTGTRDNSTTSTMFGMGSNGATAPGDCPSRMPGEPLGAEEAVVAFNPERICPAYVTVLVGTPVTWHNDGSVAATVTITASTAPSPGAALPVLAEQQVQPGATWSQTFDRADVLAFRIDVVPSFLGTIEVQQPGSDSHSHGT